MDQLEMLRLADALIRAHIESIDPSFGAHAMIMALSRRDQIENEIFDFIDRSGKQRDQIWIRLGFVLKVTQDNVYVSAPSEIHSLD